MSFLPHYPLLAVGVFLVVLTFVVFIRAKESHLRLAAARRVILALLLVVVAARPMVGSTMTISYEAGVDVVIMIDRTTSMAAEDHAGHQPRLAGVKEDMFSILSAASGSRFAVVVFDNEARVALPFTTDVMAVSSLVDAIGWRETSYGTGSDISIGIDEAQELLEQSRRERPEVGRYLVYAGDGEQTASTSPSSFSPLADLIDGGLVLGYGTTNGGPMKEYQGSDTYVTWNGERAYSRIDHSALRTISYDLGVAYDHRGSGNRVELPLEGDVLVPTERRDPRGFELYWIFAGFAVLVLAVELSDVLGRLRRAQENLR